MARRPRGKNESPGGQEPSQPRQLPRIRSGIPRLDYILKGGFLAGGTYTLLGPPGSGKTIIGNQLCFNHVARTGEKCLYVTLLAETHAKMLRHLSTLSFFDSAVVGEKLKYVSAFRALREGGTERLLDLLKRTLKEERPALLVIDGIHVVQLYQRHPRDFDVFLHELQAYTAILGTTTLLLTPANRAMREDSENVIVDGVVELTYHLVGPRAVRELTVHKFRGTDFLPGRHEVEINPDGLQIHPRTEIQFDRPPGRADEKRERMRFGVSRLDDMLHGGLLSGTSTTLLGSPGTGKTMLGLSFLVEGAKHGQPGIYFGFYEPPPRLLEKAERVGIPLEKYVKKGLVDIIWQPPLEHYMDSLAEQLLEKLRSKETNEKRRLFVDGVEGFRAAAVYSDRVPRFLSALTNQLRMLDVTSVISEELDLFKPEIELPNPEVATVAEGVILLRYLEQGAKVHRLISILKMRESEYDTDIREFAITNKGLVVARTLAGENVLSGRGRLLHGRGAKQGGGD